MMSFDLPFVWSIRCFATAAWLCCAAPAPVRAEWTEIEKAEGVKHFYDKQAVKVAHVSRYVWTLSEYEAGITTQSGDKILSVMNRWRLHCITDTQTKLATSFFDKLQGKGVESGASDVTDWKSKETAIRPGTFLDALKKEVCK